MSDVNDTVISEYEIQRGKHRLVYNCGKIPDYMVYSPSYGWLWGEVERTKKSAREWNGLIRWLNQITVSAEETLPEIGIDEFLFRIEFVCSKSFETRLIRAVGEDFSDKWLSFRPIEAWG